MNSRMLQSAFTSGEVSPGIGARTDLQLYDSAAQKLLNVWVHPSGGVSKVPGTRFIAQVPGNAKARLIPFVFSTDQVFVLEFTQSHMRVISKDGVVLDPRTGEPPTPFDLAMPYDESELDGIHYVQSNDVVYLTHVNHPPRKVMRSFDTDNAAYVWDSEEVAFAPKIQPPANVRATFSVVSAQKTWRYKVTSIHESTGEESLPSAAAAVEGTESMRAGVMKSDGSAMQDWYATVRWDDVPEANEFRIYKEKGEGLYGYIGSSIGLSFEDKNIAPNTEDTPPVEGNPFADGNNPSVVALYQQRLTCADTSFFPNTFYMSRSGSFENFTKSTFIKDDDYIEGTLDTKNMDAIVWMLSLRSLIIGTTSSVWEISGGNSKAVTPSSVSATLQSSRGSAPHIDPVLIDNIILHVSRSGRSLRDLVYNFGADSYDGEDRSIMATHLFANRRIKEIAWQESPNSVVWCVMDDGRLLGLTYMLKHQIFAWHQHDTDGRYENVCVVPGESYDNVFFVVKRTVNRQTVRYIEMMADPLEVPDDFESLSDEEQTGVLSGAFHVHSGLTYEGEPRAEFGGLEHLEGKEAVIFADGSVEPRQVVRGGKVSIKRPAGRVHIGLPYEAQIDTVNYEPPLQEGSAIGKPKRIARVVVRVENSSGFHVGINGQTVETKWRTGEVWGQPPRLRSGVAEYSVPGKWGRESCVSFRSPEPVPFTVNTVVPIVSTE